MAKTTVIQEFYAKYCYNNLFPYSEQLNMEDDTKNGGNCVFLFKKYLASIPDTSYRLCYSIKNGDVDIKNLSRHNHVILFDSTNSKLLELAGNQSQERIQQIIR